MSLRIELELGYEFAVRARFAEVFEVLADVPTSAGFFPRVERLVALGDNAFRWEMQRLGTPELNLQTVYACRYRSHPKQGRVEWTPIEGVGNAQVSGSWALARHRRSFTALTLRIAGTVQLPLPPLMARLVTPLLQAEFEALVEAYIDALIERFGGEVALD